MPNLTATMNLRIYRDIHINHSIQISNPSPPLSLSESTVSHSLPTDVIFDILSRLPVKFVTRFKCVSKAWFSHLGNGIHKMPPKVR